MPAALCSLPVSQKLSWRMQMAHEIESTDGAVFHRTPAWHGLGIVVEEAPTVKEALKLAGMEWGVDQRELYTPIETLGEDGVVNKEWVKVPSHVANFRGDNNELLGVVSANYCPVSNGELAEFCDSLIAEATGKVRIESAGSIRGGKRVWFLLKGEEFQIAKGDGIFPYLLASNGHDGGSTCRITPTSVRVVCSNTMHQVIPRSDTGELLGSAVSFKHTSNIMDRIEEARHALAVYGKTLESFKTMANDLSKRAVTSDEVKSFFLESYTADFGEIPINPQDKNQERARLRALDAFSMFARRFDDEREIAGSSAWNMINAYSGLVQHDKKGRGKVDVARVESRSESNLLGLNQDRTQKALLRAYKMSLS